MFKSINPTKVRPLLLSDGEWPGFLSSRRIPECERCGILSCLVGRDDEPSREDNKDT